MHAALTVAGRCSWTIRARGRRRRRGRR